MEKEAVAHSLRTGFYFLVLTLLLFFSGCGYRLNTQRGDNISPDIQKVYVDIFANHTPEANIESEFRNAFIAQFIKGLRFKVVNSAALADAVLKGEINHLTSSPLAYRGVQDVAAEKKISVTLALTFTAQSNAAILWTEKNFVQWEDFDLGGGSFNATKANQKNALSKLATDAAERAYRLMTSDF